MQIINWQCHFTEHQSHTWLALQKNMDEEIIHIVVKTSSAIRDKQGWSAIDMSEMDIVQFKEKGWWKQGRKILKKYPEALHVFGGFWADRRFFPLIIYALLHGHKILVMNEAYATEAVGYLSNSTRWVNRLKKLLRPVLYRLSAFIIKLISKPNQFCILALSDRAAEQFELAGFSHKQVFSFGYFVPKLLCPKDNQVLNESTTRLVFVGSLLKRKGLDLLVAAVEELNLRGLSVLVDVFGYGEPADYINPNSSSVSYKGMISFGKAQCVISKYDALILPSLHDGWGVVVNEALLQGIPAIVSSNVGAKCMIENSSAGMVFESGNKDSLKKVLSKFISNSSLRMKQKKNAGEIGILITPEYAAKHMEKVLAFYFSGVGERPKEIWCDQL